MPKTYVIADIHGRFDLLFAAMEKLAPLEPGTIIMLGDYIDRGPMSRQVLELLVSGVIPHPDVAPKWRRFFLKGNHEDIMWQTCRKLPSADWWLSNGGGETLRSYSNDLGRHRFDLNVVSPSHLDWIEKLPTMIVDKHRIYVHGGVNADRSLNQQDEDDLLWKRHVPGDDDGHGRYHVVHGHTPFVEGPIGKVNRTNLDTMAYWTGRLVIGVFDDDIPGGPIKLIEVRGEPMARKMMPAETAA